MPRNQQTSHALKTSDMELSLTLVFWGFGVLGMRPQVNVGILISGRLALLAYCGLPS
jgi:hypothetical protein